MAYSASEARHSETNGYRSFRWSGSSAPLLDAATIRSCWCVTIGMYGGNVAAGANKNEDGALACCAADDAWEFTALLDGHNSTQSTDLVVATLDVELPAIAGLLALPAATALPALQRHVLTVLGSEAFAARCRAVRGETACLIVARAGQFLWWLSIGDCVAYVFHPELAALGQHALNQRSFYEWIGQRHTFDLPVPCYATGVRELRQGQSVILLTTDGLLECGSRPFEQPDRLARLFLPGAGLPVEAAVRAALARVHAERGRDSATLIAWAVDNSKPATQPSG